MICVVACKSPGDSQFSCRQLAHSVTVDIATGGISGTIRSVAADAEDTGICYAGDALRGRQRQLLISSAKTVSNDPHNSLASGDEGKSFAVICMCARNAVQKSPGLLCLTIQMICQHDRLIPKLTGGLRRSKAKLPNASDNLCRNIR